MFTSFANLNYSITSNYLDLEMNVRSGIKVFTGYDGFFPSKTCFVLVIVKADMRFMFHCEFK